MICPWGVIRPSMEEAVDLVVLYNVEELPKGVEQQIEVLARAAELTAEAMGVSGLRSRLLVWAARVGPDRGRRPLAAVHRTGAVRTGSPPAPDRTAQISSGPRWWCGPWR